MTKPDSEYPEWLWSITDPRPPLEDIPLSKRKLRVQRKMKILAMNEMLKRTKGIK